MSFGVWPQNRQGGGGSGGRTAALQPIDGTTVAAWSCLMTGFAGGVDVADRTGNNHGMAVPNRYVIPSLIPGSSAYAAQLVYGGVTIPTSSPGFSNNSAPSPILLGEWAFDCMLWACPFPISGRDQWIYARGNYDVAGADGNTTAAILLAGASTGLVLTYYCVGASGDVLLTFPEIAYPTDGQWHFLGVSRLADGVTVSVTLDALTVTHVASAPPTGGAGATDALQSHLGTVYGLQGGAYDCMLFDAAKTPVQWKARRKIMMP